MTTAIGIALMVLFLGIAAYAQYAGRDGSESRKETTSPAQTASIVAEKGRSTPADLPLPSVVESPLVGNFDADDEEDSVEEMVTVQASPEDLAGIMAEISLRNAQDD